MTLHNTAGPVVGTKLAERSIVSGYARPHDT
jgi:hypothetical protein